MFKRILVPVDGSYTSNRGLQRAIRLARSGRAALCVLHVVDERTVVQSGYIEVSAAVWDQMIKSLRDGGRRVLAKAEAAARKQGVRVKPVLLENVARRVSDIILDTARKWRADVIVMGTHGRRGITRMVLGSDAEGVVRGASVPVLLVRAAPPKRR